MELNVIENTKSRLVFELPGEGHTFCNVLVKELQNDPDVKTASYRIEHPLIGVPTIVVETGAKSNPKKALENAIKRLKKVNDDFKKKFVKAIR